MIINFILSLYFYLFFSLATIINFIFAIFVLLLPFLKKPFHFCLAYSGKILLFLSGSRIKLYNSFTGPNNEPYLIISNHQSLFDILVVYTILLGMHYKWVIKKSLFYVPFFGFILWAADYIYLDRENKYQAFRSIQKTIDYVKRGLSVMIFPEGTRSLTDTINEFKFGSIVIAYHTGAKILPIVIKNTLFIKSKRSILINPCVIHVNFLEPIETKDKPKNLQKEMLQSIHDQMLDEYRKME